MIKQSVPNMKYSNSSTLIEEPADGGRFELVPSRRHWQSTAFGRNTLKDIVDGTGNGSPRSNRNNQTAIALKDIGNHKLSNDSK
ncbi:MAG: hypothetical protein ABFQ62_00610 [Patescibacteria group bacterium]